MPKDATEMAVAAAAILNQRWTQLTSDAKAEVPTDSIADAALRAAIQRCISSHTKTYRYVLPTQWAELLGQA
jgi:hypothetical protein